MQINLGGTAANLSYDIDRHRRGRAFLTAILTRWAIRRPSPRAVTPPTKKNRNPLIPSPHVSPEVSSDINHNVKSHRFSPVN